MSKSSINFKAVKSNSERHNFRQGPLDYVYEDLSENNLSWSVSSIQDKQKTIEESCQILSGRKLQKNATPIREAVVNLQPHHNMDDLKRLANELEKKFEIKCFQIHIHRDEGISKDEINHHAHMVFDWQDKRKGSTLRLNKLAMSQIQTLVANTLEMERGELKVNSNRERLEPIEYKRQQEEIRHQQLQEQNEILEQKKNEVRARIAAIDHRGAKEALSDDIAQFIDSFSSDTDFLLEKHPNELNDAIVFLEEQIREIENELNSLKRS
jgi:DNA-binding ferritin-like protein (Dps family)